MNVWYLIKNNYFNEIKNAVDIETLKKSFADVLEENKNLKMINDALEKGSYWKLKKINF